MLGYQDLCISIVSDCSNACSDLSFVLLLSARAHTHTHARTHTHIYITRCRHMGYSFRLAARFLLYASSHRQDITYHGLCSTSRGALAGTRHRHLIKSMVNKLDLFSFILNNMNMNFLFFFYRLLHHLC